MLLMKALSRISPIGESYLNRTTKLKFNLTRAKADLRTGFVQLSQASFIKFDARFLLDSLGGDLNT